MEAPLLRFKLAGPSGSRSKISAVIIALGGIGLFMIYPIGGVILIMLGVIPFLYYKCLEIDLFHGTYCIGVNVLGYTLGAKEPYSGIKCIFLKKNRHIASNSRRSWRPIVTTSFDSYLWLEDDTKILLSCDSEKEKAMLRIQPFAQELQTEIKDLTVPIAQV